MSDTEQSFSEIAYHHNEKQSKNNKKTSRTEYLREWRKSNPEKVKLHRRKADRKYYQKNSKKYLDREKINYHEYYIVHAIPATHYCTSCDDWDVLADHDCFPQHWPHQIWHHGGNEPDEEQIKNNIKFIINLQRKEKIPIFLVYPPQIYLNRKKYSEEYRKTLDYLVSKHDDKNVDTKTEWERFDKKINECFSKITDAIYEKRLSKEATPQ